MNININIINGNGKYIKEAIEATIDAAINYYGEKYKDIIINTVTETLYYEWQDNQTESDVIYDITNGKVDASGIDDPYYETKAFYFLDTYNNNNDKIVVTRNKYLKESYHTLVHELFGHGVFGYIDPIIQEDGEVFERNGIAFIDCKDKCVYNETLNEGFVEDATTNIMQLANLKPERLDTYFYAKQAASIIRRNLGHYITYDYLIENKGTIYDLYNKDTIKDKDEFYELAMLLDNLFIYKTTPKENKLLNSNLKRFIKRNKKNKRSL